MRRPSFRLLLPLTLALVASGCWEGVVGPSEQPEFCGVRAGTTCPSHSKRSDLDGDGCADRCEPIACTLDYVTCPGGVMPVDANGDGCARECPPQGRSCGGIAGLACDPGELCDYGAGAHCGAADQTGTCRPLPEACAEIYQPVCGCDGQTYGNECAANAEGVSVAYFGSCECELPPYRVCGGFPGYACEEGEFCSYARADLCGYADATGQCRPKPEVCTALHLPVCGCDGKTYGNECEANAAGVSVQHAGSCDVVCPAYYPDCLDSEVAADTNDDGCIDGCVPVH